jgi:indole-3-glycerol phosphate synthase
MNNAKQNILEKIIAHKHDEVLLKQKEFPLATLQNQLKNDAPQLRDFYAAIEIAITQQRPAIIAEIKKASPSKGIIRENFDPIAIAQSYAAAGAICLSVLTDETFFQGKSLYLQQAKAACSLPVLRKDFIVDAYQIYESRLLGADCILLIVAALTKTQLQTFIEIAEQLDLAILIEVHDSEELHIALDATHHNTKQPLIGINNRNLKTFSVSLNTTLDLMPLIPKDRIVISESGITNAEDIRSLRQHGVQGFLIGESLMRENDPGAKLRELLYAVTELSL